MNNQLENYVLERLKHFPTLAQILGENWLVKQLKKDRSQWDLITFDYFFGAIFPQPLSILTP